MTTVNRLSTIPFNEPGDNPRNVPSYVSARALAASVAESITIPVGPPAANYVRLAGTVDIFYSFTGTATVPVDTDDGTACELVKAQGNEEYLIIPSGATTLSVITNAAAGGIATASFFTN